jgi:hypothetical protein
MTHSSRYFRARIWPACGPLRAEGRAGGKEPRARAGGLHSAGASNGVFDKTAQKMCYDSGLKVRMVWVLTSRRGAP